MLERSDTIRPTRHRGQGEGNHSYNMTKATRRCTKCIPQILPVILLVLITYTLAACGIPAWLCPEAQSRLGKPSTFHCPCVPGTEWPNGTLATMIIRARSNTYTYTPRHFMEAIHNFIKTLLVPPSVSCSISTRCKYTLVSTRHYYEVDWALFQFHRSSQDILEEIRNSLQGNNSHVQYNGFWSEWHATQCINIRW